MDGVFLSVAPVNDDAPAAPANARGHWGERLVEPVFDGLDIEHEILDDLDSKRKIGAAHDDMDIERVIAAEDEVKRQSVDANARAADNTPPAVVANGLIVGGVFLPAALVDNNGPATPVHVNIHQDERIVDPVFDDLDIEREILGDLDIKREIGPITKWRGRRRPLTRKSFPSLATCLIRSCTVTNASLSDKSRRRKLFHSSLTRATGCHSTTCMSTFLTVVSTVAKSTTLCALLPPDVQPPSFTARPMPDLAISP